jgi:hypothetical protein
MAEADAQGSVQAAQKTPLVTSEEPVPELWTTARFLLVMAVGLFLAFPAVALGLRTFFYRDFGAYLYPLSFYTRSRLLQGELPLWNPFLQCGAPHLAQLGTCYPPSLASLLLPMPWSGNALLLLHLLWAGFGMRWLAKKLELTAFAASFAATAFVFNGVVLSSLQWLSYIAVLAWMPWVIGCALEAWKRGGHWVVLAALSSAMQLMAGMPELTLLTGIFLAVLWAVSVFRRHIQLRPSATRTLGIISLASGLAMVQLLPFLDLVTHSQRNTASATGRWSMPGWGWANLLVPLFHCYKSPQGLWFQSGQDLLPSYYLGAGLLGLALVGLCLGRNRFKFTILATVLLCYLLALGSNGYLYDWVRRAFPFIGVARYPVKFAIFPAFLLPLLAAQAVDEVRTKPASQVLPWLSAVAATFLFLMGAILWFKHQYPFPMDQWAATAWNTLWRAVLMLGVLAGACFLTRVRTGVPAFALQLFLLTLLALDALTHSPNIAPTLPGSPLAPGAWQAVNKIPAPVLGEARIMLSPAAEQHLLYSSIPSLSLDLTAKRLAQWYNLNLLDGVPKVNGAMPLHTPYYDAFEDAVYYKAGAHFGPGLLNFLSVAWYTSSNNAIEWSPRTNYSPVLTAGQAPIFVSDAEALERIVADDFQPQRFVYLPETARSLVTVSNQTTCLLTNTIFTPQRVEADTDSPVPTMAVLSQSFYHLWRASVDGRSVPLLRANLAFQAIQLPAGKHHIKLEYRDTNLMLGSLVSLLSAGLCCWLWFRMRPSPA